MIYQTLRFYNPRTDEDTLRVSAFDGRGDEFWLNVPANTPGEGRRTVIDAARQAIDDAVARGDEPGEVKC